MKEWRRQGHTRHDTVAHGRCLAPRLKIEVALIDEKQSLPSRGLREGVGDGGTGSAVLIYRCRPGNAVVLELVGNLAEVEDVERDPEHLGD